MNFARFLSESSVYLEMQTPSPEPDDDGNFSKRQMVEFRESVLCEVAQALYASGNVQNLNKLSVELINRERKACSVIAPGVALPHARCMQVKTLTMAFVRASSGVDFSTTDTSDPVQIFIAIAAPPYDDREYQRIYRQLGEVLLAEEAKQRLLEVDSPGEVIRVLNEIFH